MTDPIQLSQQLAAKSKQIKALQAKLPASPSTPQHFIEQAEINEEIRELQLQQQSIGEALLQHDRESEALRLRKLDTFCEEGTAAAAELLEKLPAFAEKLGLAFDVLGGDYAELLQLSARVRGVNLAMLNSNKPACCAVPVHIEPNNLHRVVKYAFQESFGKPTAAVMLPQITKPYDIEKEVAAIIKAVSSHD